MYDHISWSGDSMIIVFPTHKGDQEGRDAAPKHVYGNPECPEICPLLAFALHICSGEFRRSEARNSVFGSTKGAVEDRFGNGLRKYWLD
jgi:hypothetical protein